jgi:ABC-type uncharacterized transport system auxiliary subunit
VTHPGLRRAPAPFALGALRLPLALGAGLGLLLALGCADALVRPPPERQGFVLAPAFPAPVSPPGRGAVRVARVAVSPAFEREGFVYREAESRYESDFYNRFFTPPAEMMRDLLVRWLRGSGVFATVGTGPVPPPDWMLEARVTDLYVDRRETPARAVFAATLRLVDLRGRSPEVMLDRRFEASEAAEGASPRVLVRAWERALARVLAEAQPVLADEIRRHARGGR